MFEKLNFICYNSNRFASHGETSAKQSKIFHRRETSLVSLSRESRTAGIVKSKLKTLPKSLPPMLAGANPVREHRVFVSCLRDLIGHVRSILFGGGEIRG